MKKFALLTALATTLATGALAPAAFAANAKHPYRNVNHTNDAGNRTGDAATDQLNQQQLDQARTSR